METTIVCLGANFENWSDLPTRPHECRGRQRDEPVPNIETQPEFTACAASANRPNRPSAADFAPLSDLQLLSYILLGQCEALEALCDRYGRACYRLALTIVGDSYTAEEIVQDVFLKLWTMPSSYAPQRGKFSAWLLTLIRNRSIDRLRHEKHSTPSSALDFNAPDVKANNGVTPAGVLADGGNTPYEEVWHREQARVVHNALNLLPPPQREAISMAYLDGLTQREISRSLGVPLGTIKTRTQRGLLQLRKLLSRESLAEDAA